ncbi:hypothetical protein J437_LFUL018462 [Ladona fulva]|uniref:Uncharacterized protein n=1 Tax=Ladona fulva TaxID=123851 RepID=A0A8K0KS48_LADFU|nr:hypothetical protein J437_LFUL018462 [Ladona fulva]
MCSCRKNDAVDCDGASFASIFPSTLPATTREFSIRSAALQELPSGSLIHLRSLQKLDLSDNSIRRLPERLLDGVEDSIETLVVTDNLLGDHLNPVFSWPQLRGLKRLRKLDVSGNWLKSLEAGFVEGCEQLKELLLSRNDLEEVPSAALNGPRALKTIALDNNKISELAK